MDSTHLICPIDYIYVVYRRHDKKFARVCIIALATSQAGELLFGVAVRVFDPGREYSYVLA